MLGSSEFYLVSTNHLETTLWFRDEEDFKTGMNAVALVSAVSGICVLAFILMSNHVHFVLACTRQKASDFIETYKNHYSRYYSKKYNSRELLRRNGVDIRRVMPEDESLQRAIAYVQMNPPAANICINASDYPWGSGSCFFRPVGVKGILVESLSKRKQSALFHSRQPVPPSMILNADGYVDPRSFVNVKWVESIFRTPKSMNFFLTNSSKAKRRLDNESAIPAFRDQVVASAFSDLCLSLFGVTGISKLEEKDLAEVLRQIRYRFSANVHQLTRVTGIEYRRVCNLLEMV